MRPEGSPEAPSDSYFLAVCLFWTGSTRECETLLRAYLAAVEPGEQDVRRVFALALLAALLLPDFSSADVLYRNADADD